MHLKPPVAPHATGTCDFARRFEMQELLGSGTLSTVRAAVRLSDGQRLAVKQVQSDDSDVRESTRRE